VAARAENSRRGLIELISALVLAHDNQEDPASKELGVEICRRKYGHLLESGITAFEILVPP
jgi:hypothetical protein